MDTPILNTLHFSPGFFCLSHTSYSPPLMPFLSPLRLSHSVTHSGFSSGLAGTVSTSWITCIQLHSMFVCINIFHWMAHINSNHYVHILTAVNSDAYLLYKKQTHSPAEHFLTSPQWTLEESEGTSQSRFSMKRIVLTPNQSQHITQMRSFGICGPQLFACSVRTKATQLSEGSSTGECAPQAAVNLRDVMHMFKKWRPQLYTHHFLFGCLG